MPAGRGEGWQPGVEADTAKVGAAGVGVGQRGDELHRAAAGGVECQVQAIDLGEEVVGHLGVTHQALRRWRRQGRVQAEAYNQQ